MVALKEAFLVKVPNVKREDAYTSIVLPHYEFYTILVEDYDMALEEGKKVIADKGIHAVILCAGFNNTEFGDLSREFGEDVGVLIANGDSRSDGIVSKAIENAKW